MVTPPDNRRPRSGRVINGTGQQASMAAPELPGSARLFARDGFRLDAIVPQAADGGTDIIYLLGHPDGERAALTVELGDGVLETPSLVSLWPEADWPERRMRDLFGITPQGHPRAGRLVRHSHWPRGYYPMAEERVPADWPAAGAGPDFVPVRGEGVHEIPVGPIHAGIIEPGHFRFVADGERIVSLELKLFYVHRGIEKLMEGRPVEEGVALAEVVSGDAPIGHAWAYCAAVERALGLEVPAEALALRGFLLELERIACHVGDLGAIINDIGFGWVQSQCQGIREELLRAHEQLFGHRFLKGLIGVGGVRTTPPDLDAALKAARTAAEDAGQIAGIALGRSAVIERLRDTGVLLKKEALARHATGMVARACGIDADCRKVMGEPYGESFAPVTETAGDVEARFRVRLGELGASLKLMESFIEKARDARPASENAGRASGVGIGFCEGWRGECLHYVNIVDGRIRRWSPRDPSAPNWPLLPFAAAGDMVPDFPLINKSFNLSYAGNDL